MSSRSTLEARPRGTTVVPADRPDSDCGWLNGHTGRFRAFPIKPKEHRRLVAVWLKFVLPAVPQILSPILGPNYSANLVRRGEVDIRAQPCIQIESPFVPGAPAKETINNALSETWRKGGHQPVRIRYIRGSVRKLNGGMDEVEEDDEPSADDQRLRLNLVRPYSKPGMGASIGLLCSQKVSATLGGYVFVDGKKYMLTSEHFVASSQAPANNDGKDDLETIVSPSRQDLWAIENQVMQSKRELKSKIKMRMSKIYGDREVAEGELSDQEIHDPELREMKRRDADATILLDQVKKPPSDYRIGSTFKFSGDPMEVEIPRSLAIQLQLEDVKVKHTMDWSLCQMDLQTGENRHKYRSDEDATTDDYIIEEDHNTLPGEVCHDKCDAEAGATVMYLGQGSDRRKGIVGLPMAVSMEGMATQEWGIMSPEGQSIEYEHVAGDSGAWVIKENGHKLMGQVIAHTQSNVLFTPIHVVFTDVEKNCGTEVSLPPRLPDPSQGPPAVPATPLCSIKEGSPPSRPYKFLVRGRKAPATPSRILLVQDALPKILIRSASGVEVKIAHSEISHGPPYNFCSLIPVSTLLSQSLAITAKASDSPHLLRGGDLSARPVEREKQSPKSLQLDRMGDADVEDAVIPQLMLDQKRKNSAPEELYNAFHVSSHVFLRVTMNTRTSTWPVDRRVKHAKAQKGYDLYKRYKSWLFRRNGRWLHYRDTMVRS